MILAAKTDDTLEEETFLCNLYQMEIDRLNYIVSSYLRTRLKKVVS